MTTERQPDRGLRGRFWALNATYFARPTFAVAGYSSPLEPLVPRDQEEDEGGDSVERALV